MLARGKHVMTATTAVDLTTIFRTTLQLMMTSSNGNILRVTGHLCGEFAGHRRISLTKASDADLWCFLWSAPWINGWVNNREAGALIETASRSFWCHGWICSVDSGYNAMQYITLVITHYDDIEQKHFPLLSLCAGNPPVTVGFPSHFGDNTRKISRVHCLIRVIQRLTKILWTA